MDLSKMEKMMNKAGWNIACVLGIHDFNKKRICKLCDHVEAKHLLIKALIKGGYYEAPGGKAKQKRNKGKFGTKMKKDKLSLTRFAQIYEDAKKLEDSGDKFIGFIGGTPVYSNPAVPPGVIYIIHNEEFKKI
mgnify:CR=1 FL=1